MMDLEGSGPEVSSWESTVEGVAPASWLRGLEETRVDVVSWGHTLEHRVFRNVEPAMGVYWPGVMT